MTPCVFPNCSSKPSFLSSIPERRSDPRKELPSFSCQPDGCGPELSEFPLGERYGDRPGSMKITEIDRYPSLRELLSPRYLYLLSDGQTSKKKGPCYYKYEAC